MSALAQESTANPRNGDPSRQYRQRAPHVQLPACKWALTRDLRYANVSVDGIARCTQELQESMEQPARVRAQSGRRCAKLSRPG